MTTALETSKQGVRRLNVIWRLIEELRKINPEMPAQAMNAFVLVCQHPEYTLKEIADRLGVSQASITRNMLSFSKGTVRVSGKVVKGKGLLTIEEDPMDRRYKRCHLTPEGKRVRDTLINILESAT